MPKADFITCLNIANPSALKKHKYMLHVLTVIRSHLSSKAHLSLTSYKSALALSSKCPPKFNLFSIHVMYSGLITIYSSYYVNLKELRFIVLFIDQILVISTT